MRYSMLGRVFNGFVLTILIVNLVGTPTLATASSVYAPQGLAEMGVDMPGTNTVPETVAETAYRNAALDLNEVDDDNDDYVATRTDMMTIAEAYFRLEWDPKSTNIRHENLVDTPDVGYGSNPNDNPMKFVSASLCTENNNFWGCWDADASDKQVGVPYFWGGSTAIKDESLNLNPHATYEGYGYFEDILILANGPAGDVSLNYEKTGEDDNGKPIYNKQEVSFYPSNGVDCVGFVNQVWRLGNRQTMSQVSHISRPIKFKDLRPGDIVLKPNGYRHVVLFKEFIGYDPAMGEPIADEENGTRFWAYEASWETKKVVLSEYQLISSEPVKRYFDRGLSDTDKVAIKRLRYCQAVLGGGPDDCRDQENIEYGGQRYVMDVSYPRTYFAPISVVIALDVSSRGHIDGSPEILSSANTATAENKVAAKRIVDYLRPGDEVGIVAYALDAGNTSEIVLPLTKIENDDDKSEIKTVIGNIPSKSSVSVAPVDRALHFSFLAFSDDGTLNGVADSDSVRSVILLHRTGFGDYSESPPMLVKKFIDKGITIFALDVPNSTFDSDKVLKEITDSTGGEYSTDIDDLLRKFFGKIFGEGILAPFTGRIPLLPTNMSQQVAFTENLGDFDSAMGYVTVSIFQGGGAPPYFELIQPDGTVIDPGAALEDPHVTYFSGESHAAYKVRAPQSGPWMMRVIGNPGEKYSVGISISDAMNLTAETDKQKYLPGEEVEFYASIEDDTSGDGPAGFILSGEFQGWDDNNIIFTDPSPQYIYDAQMTVSVEGPDDYSGSFDFDLLDDGQGVDEVALDGVYAGIFTDTQLEGIYNFGLKIEGLNNRAGEHFVREKSLSVVVNTPPQVESIKRLTPNPTGYYEIEYEVTFSEEVVYVGVEDFVVTTTGDILGAEVASVVRKPVDKATGKHPYLVIVKTGNGNGTLRLDLVDNDMILDRLGGSLAGDGLGNGDYTDGEVFEIDKDENSLIVTNADDTDSGFCHNSCSLREAIRSAVPGDTITFDAGLTETIHLASVLTLTRDVSINGSALAERVTISGDSNGDGIPDTMVFKVTSGTVVTLNGLAIKNGRQGILSDGELTIINSIISDNEVNSSINSSGGGIGNRGILRILDSIFDNNRAVGPNTTGGGAISNSGVLTISNTTFSNNFTDKSGGAVKSSFASLIVTNSTFSGNTALEGGGAIGVNYGKPGESIAVSNSTFFGNSALYGGGIQIHGSYLALTNSSFSDNTATHHGGGLYVGLGRLDYSNTVIANSEGGDCDLGGPYPQPSGSVGINSHNFVGDGSCEAALSGDPLLGPLADNGGPTQTMALLWPGSPAIDAGDSEACPATDQRGVARPQGAGCDIGAYEFADSSSPGAFGKISPSDGATGQSSSLTLSWANSDGAISYEYCLDTSDNGACDIPWISTGDQASATPTGLAAATTYHWQVRAVNEYGTTEADGETWWSFATSLSCPAGGIIHVDQNASGNNDGSSWDNAFVDLQTPLASLSEPCEIWVAAGTYVPHVSDRAASFQLKNEIEIYGGFVGTETIRSQRDFVIHSTVLSGDLLGNDNQNIVPDEPTRQDNSYHVLVGSGTDDTAMLDGFTVTGGNATDPYNSGGGLYNSDGSPLLMNVVFFANSAVYGGGMHNQNSNPILRNVIFEGNSALFDGGGMDNVDASHPFLEDVVFEGNSASNSGGGMFNNENSYPILMNTVFSGNSAAYGAGMFNGNGSAPTLQDVTFSGNIASVSGGGMTNSRSAPSLTNVTFSGNSAATSGGGMRNRLGSNPVLQNVTFSGNSADLGGGMHNLESSSPTLRNVLIADSVRGGDCLNNSSILNVASNYNLIEDSANACGLTNGVNGNIIGSDPLLGSLADNGGFTQTYALLYGSPAINAGTNTGCPATDQRGIERPQGTSCDIGAYEYVPAVITKSAPANSATGQSLSTTLSWGVHDGATSYEYCYSSVAGPCTQWNSVGANTSVTLNDLAADYTYYWQVRAININGTTEADGGSWWSFTTISVSACTWPTYTPPTSATFSDVPMTAGHWSWVERLANSTISAGCGNGNFCPFSEVVRAQMAIFLLRSKHCGSSYAPPPVGDSTEFTDVPLNASYAPWVKQLAAEGISTGCGGGNFCPQTVVNRAQMAIFLLRAKHGATYSPPAVGASTGFGDVPVSASYAPWVKQLVAEGVTSGCGGGNFCPLQNVNRAQLATFLVRTFNLP